MGTMKMLAGIHGALVSLSAAAASTRGQLQITASTARQASDTVSQVGAAAATASAGIVSASHAATAAASAAVSDITKSGAAIAQLAQDTHKHVATKFDELIAMMEITAGRGDKFAAGFLDLLHQVKEGTINASDVVAAYRGTLVKIEDETYTVAGLLAKYLAPSMGQAQSEIHTMIDELNKGDGAVDRLLKQLEQQHNLFAKTFAELIKAYREGRITLEYLLRQAQKIKKVLPGSETDQLAQALTDALLKGTG